MRAMHAGVLYHLATRGTFLTETLMSGYIPLRIIRSQTLCVWQDELTEQWLISKDNPTGQVLGYSLDRDAAMTLVDAIQKNFACDT
jgi:hypothetical protein